jgi:hypothetical protein
MSYEGSFLRCFVCGGSVKLEDSKTDEHGRAIHENCYVWTVVLKKPPRRIVAYVGVVRERLELLSGRTHAVR